MYVELVKEMMIANEIKPIDVVALDVVLGDDHGLKAFCLGFHTMATMTNGKMYYRKQKYFTFPVQPSARSMLNLPCDQKCHVQES